MPNIVVSELNTKGYVKTSGSTGLFYVDTFNGWNNWEAIYVNSNTLSGETLEKGTPIRYLSGSTICYNIITAVTSYSHNVIGISIPSNATNFQYGSPSMVINEYYHVDGTFSDANETVGTNGGLLYSDLKMRLHYRWRYYKSYCVSMETFCFTNDSTSAPSINASVSSNNISYNNIFTSSITVSNSSNNTGITANSNYYIINYGDYIDFSIIKNGTGDAADVDIILTFIIDII